MSTTAGEAVRKLIADGKFLETLVHFGAQQVFGSGTSNYTCILVLNKKTTTTFELEQVRDLVRWRYGLPGEKETLSTSKLGAAPWGIGSSSANAVFERMKSTFANRLASVADIFVGVQTSADEIYIVHPKSSSKDTITVNWNGRDWPIEKKILRPCLHDVSLEAYARPKSNKYMIFPYDLSGKKAVLIQPAEMRKDYPGAIAYLTARKSELEKRNIVGGSASDRQFYQFGRSQSLTKFNSPKIILPALSLEARYAYDDTNVVVTGGGNGPYYLVRPKDASEYSLFYLLAVLCHPLCEAMVRTRTSVFRGGYYSHGKQFIEVLPIPTANKADQKKVEELVQKMLDAMAGVDASKTPAARTAEQREVESLRGRIEGEISKAFGLTALEEATVRAVPVPS
jgi:hypothetical protein